MNKSRERSLAVKEGPLKKEGKEVGCLSGGTSRYMPSLALQLQGRN